LDFSSIENFKDIGFIRKVDTLVKELGGPSLSRSMWRVFSSKVLKGATCLLSTVRPILVMEIYPPQRNLSRGIRVDQGTEFISRDLDLWASARSHARLSRDRAPVTMPSSSHSMANSERNV